MNGDLALPFWDISSRLEIPNQSKVVNEQTERKGDTTGNIRINYQQVELHNKIATDTKILSKLTWNSSHKVQAGPGTSSGGDFEGLRQHTAGCSEIQESLAAFSLSQSHPERN